MLEACDGKLFTHVLWGKGAERLLTYQRPKYCNFLKENTMKKMPAFLLCLVGCLTFIFLFITEPLGYSVIVACSVTALIFVLLFIFMIHFEKPKVTKQKHGIPQLQKKSLWGKLRFIYVYCVAFGLGWYCSELLDKSARDMRLFVLIGILIIVFMLSSYVILFIRYSKKST